jgi:4-amino-4-deoxy-L-arabinose transferase-like glycosyltransferase
MQGLFQKYLSLCGGDKWWAWSLAAFVTMIIVINGFRFFALEQVPAGFQVDEVSSAVTLKCLATEGVTPRLGKPGLFIDLNYGSPKPPTYVYLGSIWVKVFGASIASMRIFSAVWGILAIVGMFFVAQAVGGFRLGVITALLATGSPWLWMFSRIAYESIAGLTFLVWGLFFFVRSSALRDGIFAGVLFSLAMYSYPPLRLQILLLLVPLVLYRRKKCEGCRSSLVVFLVALVVASLPLGWGTVHGDLWGRFQQIGISSPEYLASIGKTNSLVDLSGIFIKNYLAHFDSRFLFVSGDPSFVNSTQRSGILGWAEILGLVFLLVAPLFFRNERPSPAQKTVRQALPFLFLCLIGILTGVAPAALTNYELPHALRSIGAWPFYILSAGLGLFFIAERCKHVLPGILALAILFSVVFLKDYFGDYALRSRWMFSPIGYDMARAAKTEEDWQRVMLVHVNQDYNFQYYLMQYAGDTCSGSRTKWRKLRAMLGMSPE